MSARISPTAALLFVTLCSVSCGDDSGTGPEVVVESISSVAEVYLNQALDIMQANSINRYKIEWTSFRAQAFEVAGLAQTTAGTYDAIRFALEALGDNHSFFRAPSGQNVVGPSFPSSPAPREGASAKLVVEEIGYVSVSAFSGTAEEAKALATSYHEMIEGVDTLGVCGWVVDLRGNSGGNMWPMIAGIGELAGEGTLGFFVGPDSASSEWGYDDGSSWIEGFPATTVDDPYRLLNPDPPVAVMTSGYTASSGEATAIAFRARPDTRSFGEPTYGVSTANRGYTLSDGAMIILTVATMADRTGQLYGGKVYPDRHVGGPPTGDPITDPPLDDAIVWLQSHPACQGN
jgi:carboxyl-terminal processing protease